MDDRPEGGRKRPYNWGMEMTVMAAYATGAPGFLDRLPADAWPVRQQDLDRTIARIASERGMRVLSVGESFRRGPLPIHDVDDGHMGQVIAHVAQLCARVEWEPLLADDDVTG